MRTPRHLSTLLLTDIVDSTSWTDRLGEDGAAILWFSHERMARDLLRLWRGREIDKSDGFLLKFDSVEDALSFGAAYHDALHRLQPSLQARVGLHVGLVAWRENSRDDVEQGAKPLEVEGVVKHIAARIMALSPPGRTLLSAAAREALPLDRRAPIHALGHWRFKGLDEAIELYEDCVATHFLPPPPDGPKGWRVMRQGDHWVPIQNTAHSLPAERDCFVGRQVALQSLSRRFQSGARLVSVVGTAGTGKTRLAIRHGWTWLGDYEGGVWFCDLSAAHTLDGILHAVGQGLGLALSGAEPARQIGDAIAGRGHCLLVVDNFEQVTKHAEATVGQWLNRAPMAKFLVTTRARLGITGEETLELQPLPDADGIELLRERASASGAIAFTAQDEAAVPELVEMLDALPLAIELAASRMRVLPPRQMLARMGERFRLLSGVGRGQDRQATLRAALDWSWDLLSESEREVLVQLSVFEGGFTLKAAEAIVVALPSGTADWTVDLIQSLVDKSLVRRCEGVRFDLLRSVQEYAAQTRSPSNSSTLDEAKRRHCIYFARLGELDATADQCAETDNLVVGCRRALDAGDTRTAALGLTTAWCALRIAGPLTAAIELAEQLQRKATGDPVALASALWVGGNARQLLGQEGDARHMLEDALRIAPEERLLTGRIASTLGTLLANAGDAKRAGALLEKALAAATADGDSSLRCRVLNSCGVLANLQGRPDEAGRCYEAALTIARQSQDARWEGAVLGNLGQLHHNRGAHEEARTCYERALVMVKASGDLRFEGNTRCNLGLLHHEQGRSTEAMEEFEVSLAIATRIGHVQLQAVVSCNLGLAHDAADQYVQARNYFRAALLAARAGGHRRTEALVEVYQGRLLSRLGEYVPAVEHLQRAQSLLEHTSDQRALTLMLCARADVNARSGHPSSASRFLEEARSQFQTLQSTDDAEVRAELSRVEQVVNQYC